MVSYNKQNLINDTAEFQHDTPIGDYKKIGEEILKDFSKYDKYKKLIISQFEKQYEGFKNGYRGYELAGSGISQAGNDFRISDLAIVDFVFVPAIKAYYDKDITFRDIKMIVMKDVSKDHPSFIKRSVIDILLDNIVENKNKEESIKLLKKLSNEIKGLPSNVDMIFFKISQRYNDFSTEDLNEFLSMGIYQKDKQVLPRNVFVLQLTFRLINGNSKKAKGYLEKFLNSSDFYKYDSFHFNTLDNLHILNNDRLKKNVLVRLLSNNEWRRKNRDWNVESASEMLATLNKSLGKSMAEIFKKDPDEKIEKEKESFSLRSLPKLINNTTDAEEAYKFIMNKIKDRKPVDIIEDSYARERILDAAEKMAKDYKMYKEALNIVELFIDDPDPVSEKEYKGKSDFNYSKRIRDGEEEDVITSVRGRVAWVLQQTANNNDTYVRTYGIWKKMFNAENSQEKKAKEGNLYIIQQLLIPLIVLTARRVDKKFGINKPELKEEMKNILLNEVLYYTKFPAMAEYLLNVFSYLKDINTEEANRVVESFKDNPKGGFFLIYFGIYRKDHYEELGGFDPKHAQNVLEEVLKTSTSDIKQDVIYRFERILRDDPKNNKDRLKPYLKLLFNSDIEVGNDFAYTWIIKSFFEAGESELALDWVFKLIDGYEKQRSKIVKGNHFLVLRRIIDIFSEKDQKTIRDKIKKSSIERYIYY